MISFDTLIDKARASNPNADTGLLRRAYDFSAAEHAGQKRRSGEPYLVHPLEVASLVADMRLDDVAIAAGLLHDVVEDTLTTIERVRELFGADVAHVVEGVTKISSISFSTSEERQAENFRKMLLAMVDDHPRHPREARRPASQHADPRPPARGPPPHHRPGDPRHLRAHRPPAGHEEGQGRARGPRLQAPRPQELRDDAGLGRAAPQGHAEGGAAAARDPGTDADRRPHPGRPHRVAHQAALRHPSEDQAAAHPPRAGLRPRSPSG